MIVGTAARLPSARCSLNRSVCHIRSIACQGRASKALQELFDISDEKDTRAAIQPQPVPPAQPVPDSVPKPPWYHGKGAPHYGTEVHDAEGIAKMRAVCALAARILDHAGTLCKPGTTTEEIDAAVHGMSVDAGAYPSPLRYGSPPFPKSVCTSVNEVICHGIPDGRPLEDGDIVNVDVTVWLDGYHGDTSRTFLVGDVPDATRSLVAATRAAMDAGIDVCRPGVNFQEIGAAIEKHARTAGFAVNKDFIGHGVGRAFHGDPWVLPFKNREKCGVMEEGQTFTVEPILHAGRPAHRMWKDKWTAVARDGRVSAQFEHTVLVTADGVERLTAWP